VRGTRARHALARDLLADALRRGDLGVVKFIDVAGQNGLALVGGQRGERARKRRAAFVDGQRRDPLQRLVVERERREADAPAQAVVGVAAAVVVGQPRAGYGP
jgi:hypothetical protein